MSRIKNELAYSPLTPTLERQTAQGIFQFWLRQHLLLGELAGKIHQGIRPDRKDQGPFLGAQIEALAVVAGSEGCIGIAQQ